MATVTRRGTPVTTSGDLPAIGSPAPDFALVKTDLEAVSLKDFAGQTVVLSIFPSIDTPTCATSVRRFNAELDKLEGVAVLCVSADLPFAHKRFCGAEGLERVLAVSDLRDRDFGKRYGVTITDSAMAGLMTRAIVVIGKDGVVKYTELVPEIGSEPDYESALKAARS